MRYNHPHTIQNRMGEQLTFVKQSGERLEVENAVQPGAVRLFLVLLLIEAASLAVKYV